MKSPRALVLLFIRLLFICKGFAQELLPYFNGNKDSLTAEAMKLIHLPELIFQPFTIIQASQSIATKKATKKTPECRNCSFTTRDQRRIFALHFGEKSPHTFGFLSSVKGMADDYTQMALLLQKAILENSQGKVQLIEGPTHDGLTVYMQPSRHIAEWFSKLK